MDLIQDMFSMLLKSSQIFSLLSYIRLKQLSSFAGSLHTSISGFGQALNIETLVHAAGKRDTPVEVCHLFNETNTIQDLYLLACSSTNSFRAISNYIIRLLNLAASMPAVTGHYEILLQFVSTVKGWLQLQLHQSDYLFGCKCGTWQCASWLLPLFVKSFSGLYYSYSLN